MSTSRLKATADDSKGPLPVLAAVLGLLGAIGAVLVAFATTAVVIEIQVLTTSAIEGRVDTEITGGERHGPAFVVIALLAAVMLAGALLRRARPAALAVAACGIAVLGIALVDDRPDTDEPGPVAELYENASARPGPGYRMELGGGLLLLIAGAGLLVAPRGAPGRRVEPTPAPEPEPVDDDDPSGWFSGPPR